MILAPAYVIKSSGGVTDHGGLTGLVDDDHAQYHNDARGDARYLQKASNLGDLPNKDSAIENLIRNGTAKASVPWQWLLGVAQHTGGAAGNVSITTMISQLRYQAVGAEPFDDYAFLLVHQTSGLVRQVARKNLFGVRTLDDGSTAPALEAIPRWWKISITESAFTGLGTSEQVDVLELPAGGVIHSVKVKPTTAAAGVTVANLAIGTAGDASKYSNGESIDWLAAVAGTNFKIWGPVAQNSEDHGSAVRIKANLQVAGGEQTASLTAGAFEVYFLLSKAA